MIVGTETEGARSFSSSPGAATPPEDCATAVAGDHRGHRAGPPQPAGRGVQLFGPVAQSAHTASPEQQQRIVDIVNNARREIYQILGESG